MNDDVVAQALALWPILVIALGVGLLLRRTRFGVAGGMLAAAVPGLLIGGVVVAAPLVPDIGTDCGHVRPTSLASREGSFAGAASVELRLTCGDMTVTTVPGTGWQLRTSGATSRPAVVEAAADRLSVSSPVRAYRFGLPWDGDDWQIALPTSSALDVTAALTAGRGHFDLAGARLGSVRLDVNAAEATVDLGQATADRFSLDANAAKVSLDLPSDDFSADISVNAGAVAICAPSDLGLRVRHEGVLSSADYSGLVRTGDVWQSPGYETSTHHADVTVSVNVGSVDLNPEGGCK